MRKKGYLKEEYALRWTRADGKAQYEHRVQVSEHEWKRIKTYEDAKKALEQQVAWHKRLGIYAADGRKISTYADDGICRSENRPEDAIVKYEIICRVVSDWVPVEKYAEHKALVNLARRRAAAE